MRQSIATVHLRRPLPGWLSGPLVFARSSPPLTQGEVQETVQAFQEPISIDMPVTEGEAFLGDFLPRILPDRDILPHCFHA